MDRSLLETHVERFNCGVRSGDFEPMLAAFAADAEMVFEGAPTEPFLGREAIAGAAYAEQPPVDEVRLLGSVRSDGGVLVSDYAWATNGQRAGRILLTFPQRGDRSAGRDVRAAYRVTFANTGAHSRPVARARGFSRLRVPPPGRVGRP